ncbi:MAG: hypothetical protein IT285_07960 [Bdellovibrionales bacterium]|nr:hypothetical protein [Bdellovibrionales bacterium]
MANRRTTQSALIKAAGSLGLSLALSGCLNTDLTEFNVTGSGAGLIPVQPGTFSFQGITSAAFVNAATVNAFTVGGACGDEGREIGVETVPAGALANQSTTCTGAVWSVTHDYSVLAEGVVVLQAHWMDEDPATGQLLGLTKDTASPGLNLTTLVGGELLRGGQIASISWTSSDSNPRFDDSITIERYNGVLWNTITPATDDTGIYSWTVPMLNGASYQVRVILVDAAGNSSAVTSPAPFTIDSIAPSATIQQRGTQLDPDNTLPIEFDLHFSEPINAPSLTPGMIVQTGTATSVGWTITNQGNDQDFLLSATSVGSPGTVIPSLPVNQITDVAGNLNTASSSPVDGSVTWDNVQPSVTINQAGGQADPVNATPVNFTVVFSEPINPATFTTADIGNSGSAPTVIWSLSTSDNQTYTLSATAVGGNGSLMPYLNSGTVQDPAGNGNAPYTATDNTVTYDTTPPSVMIEQAAAQTADPTNALPIQFTVTFSEAINAGTFASSDIVQTGTATGVTWSINLVSPSVFTVRATAVSGANGTLIPVLLANAVTDLAGNLSTASSAGADSTVTYDNIAPTVTVDQDVGQPDPVNFGAVNFQVTFSEPINTGSFTSSDITNNGTATVDGWIIINEGDSRNFTLQATPVSADGTIIPSIAAGTVLDPAGNLSSASTSADNSVLYDTIAPTVTINQSIGQPDSTNTLPISFDVVFSEPINLATISNLDFVQNGTSSPTTWSLVEVSAATTFTLTLSVAPTDGTAVPILPAVSVMDAAGNGNMASTSTDNTVVLDRIAPAGNAVLINSGAAQTNDRMVSVVADGPEAGIERYVTLDPTCATGGSWQPSSSGFFMMDLGSHFRGSYTIAAKFRDVAGNESGCMTDSINLEVLEVAHVFPVQGRWGAYVKSDENPGQPLHAQPGNACIGNETTRDACFHSGAYLKVVTDEGSCAGLSMTDSEDVFVWRCEPVLGVPTFFTAGFRHGRGLGDLIRPDRGGFRAMSVTLIGGVAFRDRSAPYTWWSNPVAPLNPGASPSAVTVLDATPGLGTVWVLPATDVAGGGFNLNADGISLTMLPGGSYEFDGTAADNCEPATGETAGAAARCLIATGGNRFLWIEGKYLAGNGGGTVGYIPSRGLLVRNSPQTRIHHFQYTGAMDPSGARMGIDLNNNASSRGVTLTDVGVANMRGVSSTGINVQGYGAILEQVSVSEANTCMSVNSTTSTDSHRLKNIRVSNCAPVGITVTGQSPVFSGVQVTHTNNAITSSASNARFTMLTTGRVNSGSNNFIANTGSTGTIVHQMLTYGDSRGFSSEGGTNLTLSEAAFSRMNPGNIINSTVSGSLKITGNLLLTDNTCTDAPDSNADYVSDCTAGATTSNHSRYGITRIGSSTFYGPLLGADNDAAYGAVEESYDTLTSWLLLANPFRAFGSDDMARCVSPMNCVIYDWRLLETDPIIRNKALDPSAETPLFAPGGPCPFDGNATVTAIDGTTTYLRPAAEILLDWRGNDDGLCESNEDCIYTPNFGAYQGTGDPYSHGCTFTNGAAITNVKLFAYPQNGVSYPDGNLSPPPGLGGSRF